MAYPKFTVIDKHTGEYPDVWKIARRCKWAKYLVYCDIEGFALTEEGQLILMDECGNTAYCPSDRFEVIWNDGNGQYFRFGKSAQQQHQFLTGIEELRNGNREQGNNDRC